MSRSDTHGGVVVTGTGAVTAVGQTLPETWASIRQGRSGIGPLEGVDTDRHSIRIAAQIRDFDCKARLGNHQRDKTILLSERYSWLAAAAADEAIAQSGLLLPLENPRRVACVIGSGAGGQISAEKACRDRFVDNKRAAHPLLLIRIIGSSAAAHVGLEYGIKGPVFGAASACASGAHAIAIGYQMIRGGTVDVAVVGASESMITFGMLLALEAMGLASTEGCYPFAKRRSGLVLGEGAGILVLESRRHAEQRGARILASLDGVGMTAGSSDMINADTEGMAAAMRIAMADARISARDVGYLNAHAGGLAVNDANELDAIRQVFEGHGDLAVSSTKPMHGHAMGATAAMEAALCVKALEEQWVPPTLGLGADDRDCGVDLVPDAGREHRVRYAMSNAFGLSGLNAVLVFGQA